MNHDETAIAHYLSMAYQLATNSPDPSTQNGCVIVSPGGGVTGGYNTFPAGVKPRLERPQKYSFIEHCERNAIYRAARYGASLDGSTMFLTWVSCAECARALVGAGIKTLVRHTRPQDMEIERWAESLLAGDLILLEGGVDIIDWDGEWLEDELPPAIMRDGEKYQP